MSQICNNRGNNNAQELRALFRKDEKGVEEKPFTADEAKTLLADGDLPEDSYIEPGADLSEIDASDKTFEEVNAPQVNLTKARLNQTEWEDCEIPGAVFDEAELKEAEMEDTNLTKTSFKGAKGEGLKIDEADISQADFSNATLDGLKAREVTITGAKFPGASLKKAKLMDSRGDLESAESTVDFGGADLSEADLSDARMRATMTRANLQGTIFTDGQFPALDLSSVKSAEGAVFKDLRAANATLTSANLTDANFTGAKLPGSEISGVDFSGSTLDEINLNEAKAKRLKLSNVKGKGASFEKLEASKKVDISKSQLADVKLNGLKTKKLKIDGSNLDGLSKTDSEIAEIKIIESMLRKADMSGTICDLKVEDSDLSGSNLRYISNEGASKIRNSGLDSTKVIFIGGNEDEPSSELEIRSSNLSRAMLAWHRSQGKNNTLNKLLKLAVRDSTLIDTSAGILNSSMNDLNPGVFGDVVYEGDNIDLRGSYLRNSRSYVQRETGGDTFRRHGLLHALQRSGNLSKDSIKGIRIPVNEEGDPLLLLPEGLTRESLEEMGAKFVDQNDWSNLNLTGFDFTLSGDDDVPYHQLNKAKIEGSVLDGANLSGLDFAEIFEENGAIKAKSWKGANVKECKNVPLRLKDMGVTYDATTEFIDERQSPTDLSRAREREAFLNRDRGEG